MFSTYTEHKQDVRQTYTHVLFRVRLRTTQKKDLSTPDSIHVGSMCNFTHKTICIYVRTPETFLKQFVGDIKQITNKYYIKSANYIPKQKDYNLHKSTQYVGKPSTNFRFYQRQIRSKPNKKLFIERINRSLRRMANLQM